MVRLGYPPTGVGALRFGVADDRSDADDLEVSVERGESTRAMASVMWPSPPASLFTTAAPFVRGSARAAETALLSRRLAFLSASTTALLDGRRIVFKAALLPLTEGVGRGLTTATPFP